MPSTKNDLAQKTRTAMIKLCNNRLADSIVLQTQVKQAHWNVKGPNFIGLHELFDDISGAVLDYIDLIAERAVQLGGIAEGTAKVAVEKTKLTAYPLDITRGKDHVEALSNVLAAYGKLVRAAIDTANEANDADTADLFTEVSRGIDKWLWFVEAHQQADA